jgi:hypothetical protein
MKVPSNKKGQEETGDIIDKKKKSKTKEKKMSRKQTKEEEESQMTTEDIANDDDDDTMSSSSTKKSKKKKSTSSTKDIAVVEATDGTKKKKKKSKKSSSSKQDDEQDVHDDNVDAATTSSKKKKTKKEGKSSSKTKREPVMKGNNAAGDNEDEDEDDTAASSVTSSVESVSSSSSSNNDNERYSFNAINNQIYKNRNAFYVPDKRNILEDLEYGGQPQGDDDYNIGRYLDGVDGLSIPSAYASLDHPQDYRNNFHYDKDGIAWSKSSSKTRCKRMVCCLSVAVLLLLGMITGLAVGLSNRNKYNESEPEQVSATMVSGPMPIDHWDMTTSDGDQSLYLSLGENDAGGGPSNPTEMTDLDNPVDAEDDTTDSQRPSWTSPQDLTLACAPHCT